MTFKSSKKFYFVLMICTFLWNQQTSFLTQKIALENSYRDKVVSAVAPLLGRENFIVIVNVEFSTASGALKKTTSKSDRGSSNSYTPIPGLLPTLPGGRWMGESNSSFGRVEVNINLNENLATGPIKQEIKSLIEKVIPETRECEDCIKIESLGLLSSGESDELEELKKEISQLKFDQNVAEENILKKELQDAEDRLKEVQESKKESDNIIKSRDDELERRDSLAHARLLEFEKSRTTLDSIRNNNTENELRQVRDSKMRSDSTLLSQTLGIVEKQVDSNKDEKEESSLGMQIGSGDSSIMSSVIFILLIICLIIITFLVASNKKPKPIYLKPKVKNPKKKSTENISEIDEENANNTPSIDTTSSIIKRNEDAIQSELRSLRQTAVSLSVGEKESASALIKEWLEDNPNKGENPAEE